MLGFRSYRPCKEAVLRLRLELAATSTNPTNSLLGSSLISGMDNMDTLPMMEGEAEIFRATLPAVTALDPSPPKAATLRPAKRKFDSQKTLEWGKGSSSIVDQEYEPVGPIYLQHWDTGNVIAERAAANGHPVIWLDEQQRPRPGQEEALAKARGCYCVNTQLVLPLQPCSCLTMLVRRLALRRLWASPAR